MDYRYKVVVVKHPNCGVPYTFQVPENLELEVGNFVLCETKKSNLPQIARCITPSFRILGVQLTEFYGIIPKNLKPVVGVLKPVMFANKAGECDDENG